MSMCIHGIPSDHCCVLCISANINTIINAAPQGGQNFNSAPSNEGHAAGPASAAPDTAAGGVTHPAKPDQPKGELPPAVPDVPEFKRLRSGLKAMAGGNVEAVYSQYCMKSDYDTLRSLAEQLREMLVGEMAATGRAEAECARMREDAERMRKKFDQLLPGEHVWHLPDTLIHYPYCSICGIIKRKDGANSPCKGAQELSLRDAARKDRT